MDVVFALDASGSMSQAKFTQVKEFVKKIILGLDIGRGSQVGIETFADTHKLQFHLNEYVLILTYDGPSVKEKIFKYFFSPPYFGGRKYI